MAELETNLLNALQNVESASTDKPCGCHEKAESGDMADVFGFGETGDASNLEAQLDAALGAAVSGAQPDFAGLDMLSFDEEMAFAGLKAKLEPSVYSLTHKNIRVEDYLPY